MPTLPTYPSGTAPAAGPVAHEEAETTPWVANGIAAGVLGASVVAAFFLVVDLLAGRPFWTPSVLAAALFRGELPAAGSTPEPVMVLAFTGLHVAVFVAFALPAAFWALAHFPSSEGPGKAGLLAVALFAGFELVFMTLAATFASGLVDALRAGRVTAANALAAIAMAGFVFARAGRDGAPRSA